MDSVANLADLLTSAPPRLGCLANDLQFFVDARGRMHHLDLDRCFDWGGEHIVREGEPRRLAQLERKLKSAQACLDKLSLRLQKEIP